MFILLLENLIKYTSLIKDKASVLSNIKEYIGSLKSQVEELNKRNKILKAEYIGSIKSQVEEQPGNDIPHHDSSGFSSERQIIRIIDVEESTSESQVLDVQVNVRGALILGDLVVRILEFMKQVENVTVMSIDARTQLLETTQTIANRVVLRLRIQVYIFHITFIQKKSLFCKKHIKELIT
ncbi:putative transcription factor bHLH family [Helianthus anomalus]